MSAPKSITKTQYKDGKTILTFTNEVDKCQYYINELNRGALRDVAKFVISKFAENILNTFNSRKTIVNKKGKEVPNLSNMKKQAFYSVWASKNTIYPRVQIGLNLKENTGFNLYWQEVGSSKTRRKGLLTNSVKDNVSEIIKIESQYLSALNKDDKSIESLIDENEMEGSE